MKKKKAKPINVVKELKNKTILVTGGAGSIGSHLTKRLLEYPIRSVRVLDIDEYGLFKLKREVNDDRLRLLLGSILDKDRIEMAVDNVDIIIHAAAVKNIEISEFNPIQTVETNINGIINMIKTVSITKPKKFINISTDKSVDASTLYGTTKQLGERLISWAGMHIEKTKFASVRFGNVIETKGNVFEIWEKEAKAGLALSITNPKMKRYFFHIDDAVDFILKCLLITNKGEIFVPKMKSFNIKQLADKISKKQKIIGLRQGEKMDEILISEAEKDLAKEYSDMWRIQHYSS